MRAPYRHRAPQAQNVWPQLKYAVSFLQEKQEAIMNFQFLRRGMTARPARHLKARSSLVRRLVQAHDDPGK